jgi:hypothetical protein
MDAIREWVTLALQHLAIWLGAAWHFLVDGVLHDWEMRYFIFAMGAILLAGLFGIWRRKA